MNQVLSYTWARYVHDDDVRHIQHDVVRHSDIASSVVSMLRNTNSLTDMRAKCMALVDENGASRVTEALMNLK